MLYLIALLAVLAFYVFFMENKIELFEGSREEEDFKIEKTKDGLSGFQERWNGKYTWAQKGSYLEIDMENTDYGTVRVPGDHWQVRSYGPNVLQGASFEGDSQIFVEIISENGTVPKINARTTDKRTGKVQSLSSPERENLNAYSVKIVSE